MYGMVSGHHKNHQHQSASCSDRSNHTSKSLSRRVFNFLKQTWTGVKFSLGKITYFIAHSVEYDLFYGRFPRRNHLSFEDSSGFMHTFAVVDPCKHFLRNGKMPNSRMKMRNSDPELEDPETQPIHRPHSLKALCKTTKFTEKELKRIYRCFKSECPTGIIKEDAFKNVYSQFFPQGANNSQYAHYVFSTLDQSKSGFLHFEDLIHGLSTLCRGSLEEKLQWTFSLYDINKDGTVSRDEMTMIVTAVYELMGKFAEQMIQENTVSNKVDSLFQKMDINKDGFVTLEEFLECCKYDEDINRSMAVFETTF